VDRWGLWRVSYRGGKSISGYIWIFLFDDWWRDSTRTAGVGGLRCALMNAPRGRRQAEISKDTKV
jgi:hypothetical protein